MRWCSDERRRRADRESKKREAYLVKREASFVGELEV
jgi:hypothetical protein